MTLTILIAEDEPLQRQMLAVLLEKKLGHHVIAVENGMQAVERVRASNVGEINLVILDIQMPVMDGFEALKAIRHHRPDVPLIMLTGSDDTTTAVRAIKEGAGDFIVKPPDVSLLEIAIKNVMRVSALSRELSKLKRDKEGALVFTDLIGHQAGLAEAVSVGRKAAASDVPVLVMGDTGVGKELFARAIHGESRRVGAPFIALNCGAIPENLVESTLFGHEKGAFTGATMRSIGKFREAEGGTIFLDEIGELPLDAQVKLLRVLQQKEVEPVGAGRQVKVNVRIISATNRDLRQDVQAGRFREDLYFRLNVLPITVPRLVDRASDIIPLAEYFIQALVLADGLTAKTLTPDAKEYLRHHRWPGNVRELQNVMHRALVLADGQVIDRTALEHIHESSDKEIPAEIVAASELHLPLRHADGSFKTMEQIEAETMHIVLKHYEQNITRAADALGIAKSTFYRKIKEIDG